VSAEGAGGAAAGTLISCRVINYLRRAALLRVDLHLVSRVQRRQCRPGPDAVNLIKIKERLRRIYFTFRAGVKRRFVCGHARQRMQIDRDPQGRFGILRSAELLSNSKHGSP
jgi:hypothetical protein